MVLLTDLLGQQFSGSQGSIGSQGNLGSQGTVGAGSQGSIGSQGTIGAGSQGSIGSQGTIGAQGPITWQLTVGTTAPGSPSVNDLWVDTN